MRTHDNIKIAPNSDAPERLQNILIDFCMVCGIRNAQSMYQTKATRSNYTIKMFV